MSEKENKKGEVLAAPGWPSLGKFRFWLDWVSASSPLTFTYHYGFLALDKGQMLPVSGVAPLGAEHWVPCEEVTEMARLAYDAYEAGKVVLVQRRFEHLWYEYIAVRCARVVNWKGVE